MMRSYIRPTFDIFTYYDDNYSTSMVVPHETFKTIICVNINHKLMDGKKSDLARKVVVK